MSGLFDKVSSNSSDGDYSDSIDPFGENPVAKNIPRKKALDTVKHFSDESEDAVEIEKELPFLELVKSLPGVADSFSGITKGQKTANKQFTLVGLNKEVKDFTDVVKADRLYREERGEFAVSEFVYDVDLVRVFGQYGASQTEMAAYFGVDISTIRKLMRDKKSDFFRVYSRAKAFLHLSLRQVQVKSALAGSERLMIHLGNVMLDQRESSVDTEGTKETVTDRNNRKKRIVTLTKQIQEFDVD